MTNYRIGWSVTENWYLRLTQAKRAELVECLEMKNKNIAIIGNGAWGKAIFQVMSQNSKNVRLVGRGETVTEELIVIAVPTNNIHELKDFISPVHDRPIIINTSKGIEEKTHRLPREIIKTMFPDCRYYTLVGPSFAGEVMQDMPTIVNLGYGDEQEEAAGVATLFQTRTFRVRQAEAIPVLELSAALKNIYAIGCGIADGLGYEINTRTLLTVIAIEEIQRLFACLGLASDTNSTAGTIGDLMLTCNSPESRNFSFGRAIAQKPVKTALQAYKGVVEGYTSLASVAHWENESGGKLPLAALIRDIVDADSPQTVRSAFNTFVSAS